MKRHPVGGALFGRRWLAPMAVSIPFVLGLLQTQPATAQGKWTPIPCSQSGLSTMFMQKCYQGPVNHGYYGTCLFHLYSAWGTTREESSSAFALIVNASVDPRCYVKLDPNFRTDFPRGLPLLVKHSSNWSDITHIGDIKGMYFDLPGRHCFAYDRPGRRWRSGYDSDATGFVCGALGKSALTSAQIEEFVGSVHVRSQ